MQSIDQFPIHSLTTSKMVRQSFCLFFCATLLACTESRADIGDPWRLYSHTGQNAFVEYSNFDALIEHMKGSTAVCAGWGYYGCQITGMKYGARYLDQYQFITVDMTGCYHDKCGYTMSWGEEYLSHLCPSGQIFEMIDGQEQCVDYADYYLSRPTACPWIGRPVNPLTGVQREQVDLGITIGRANLSIVYDTHTKMPAPSAASTWIVAPPPSFGELWESNLHKKISIQAAAAGAQSANAIAIDAGASRHETLYPVVQQSSECGPHIPSAWTPNQSDGFASLTDALHSYVRNSNGDFVLLDRREQAEEVYLPSGDIASAALADGGRLAYTYSSEPSPQAPVAGLLTSIQDQFGRVVNFYYETPAAPLQYSAPRIKSITAADGASTTFEYDPNFGYLTGVTHPDHQSQHFVYEQAGLPWAMTGIVDESNGRYVTLTYDPVGRATGSHEGASANQFEVSYPQDPMAGPHWEIEKFIESSLRHVVCRIHKWVTPDSQVYTDPAQGPITLNASSINGMPYVVGRSQPAGSGCEPSTNAASHDGAGNLVSEDDFNGNRSCFAYERSRNLETVRVDGMASSKACPASLDAYTPSPSDAAHPERKTTTVWHPDWALKTLLAEPKKITTWVYNGQVDPIAGDTPNCAPTAPALPDGKPIAVLCRRYEQATSDLTGGAGITSANNVGNVQLWTYTYNQYGQVLTQTEPKQSATDVLNHTTAYTYYAATSFPDNVTGHTLGDLQQVSDARGHVTQFTLYDKAGRLLSSTDANGVVTTRSYWPRGWIHTVTVTPPSGSGAAQTTTYAYWPTGLLETVTLPDGGSLSYTYDTAHRLTDVVDAAGNKVHYLLDNTGNRTSEQVSDVTGELLNTIARVYDKLNRLQTITGAKQ